MKLVERTERQDLVQGGGGRVGGGGSALLLLSMQPELKTQFTILKILLEPD